MHLNVFTSLFGCTDSADPGRLSHPDPAARLSQAEERGGGGSDRRDGGRPNPGARDSPGADAAAGELLQAVERHTLEEVVFMEHTRVSCDMCHTICHIH